MFKGKTNMHAEWKANLLAYMRAVAIRGAHQWATETPRVQDDVGAHFGDESGVVKECSASLYAQLVPSTTGHTFSLVNNCPGGHGLEPMRKVVSRFEPRTPGTKGAVLKVITTYPREEALAS